MLLKLATIKGKNMLPIGHIIFSLRVAPLRIETNLKGILPLKRQGKNVFEIVVC